MLAADTTETEDDFHLGVCELPLLNSLAPKRGLPRKNWTVSSIASFGTAALIISFVFVIHTYRSIPNYDSSVYVVEAQRLLAGGRFYLDILETNPPLIVFLTAPGVLISEITGLDPWTGFIVWVCFLVFVSWLVAVPYLLWAFPDKPATLLTAIYLVTVAIRPCSGFSEREHLTIVLFLPGLLWFAAREAGRPSPPDLRCLTALLLGALGLLIKPFLLVVLAVLVLVRAATHRDWRMLFGIETAVTLFVCLLYATLIYAFFRDWFSAIILVTQVYFGFDNPWLSVILDFGRSLLSFAVTVLVFQITPMAPRRRVFLRQLVVAAAVFFAIAILQHKGWYYHALPGVELTFLLVAMLGLQSFDLLRGAGTRSKTLLASSLALLCLGGFFINAMAYYYVRGGGELRSEFLANPFARSVDELAAGRPWLALDTAVFPAFPTTLLVNGQWSSRSVHQWMIPGIVKLSAGDLADRTRARLLQQIATRFVTEDLERYHPVLVAVSAGDHMAISTPFDLLQFFAEDGDFRRAWGPYRLVRSIEGWQFYIRS